MRTPSRAGFVCLVITVVVGLAATANAQLPPDEALAALHATDGIDVSLFASEPMITNPSAIDVDTHGRVWVAQIEFYRKAAEGGPPKDKIQVLEDTDGDGVADRATVFAEGLFCPMSICVAGEKVYVATSPDLWVYEDRDGDLKADGPPKKLLTGFGGYNHDHGAHSLVLGPDHKWWMSHGDRGFDVTGTDGSHVKYEWGAVLRGELDGSQLELAAVNFRNPYEVCVSSFGEAFLSDNDNDGNFSTRICWIMEGGNYGWFGGPPAKVPPDVPYGEGWHFRAHIPGFVPATLVTGFGSPCGMCFYEGDAFGPKYTNVSIHADAGPREVRVYRHTPHGAGMKTTSETILDGRNDGYFRPVDVCAAPDGSLFVADWYDGGVGGHAYNNPHQGRVYRLRPKNRKLARIEKPGPYANVADAIVALASPNLATQYLARECLLSQPAESSSALVELVNGESTADATLRARALWLLDRMGEEHRQPVLEALGSEDADFRALALRILRRHGDMYAAEILPLADDSSAVVRREVILAIANIEGGAAEAAWLKLAATYDGTDRYLLEALNIAADGRRKKLYKALMNNYSGRAQALRSNDSPILQQAQLMQVLDAKATVDYLVQAIADEAISANEKARVLRQLGTIESADAAEGVFTVAMADSAPEELQRQAFDILRANRQNRWRKSLPNDKLAAGLKGLLAQPEWQGRALALIGEANLRTLAPDIIAIVRNKQTPADVRAQAVRVAAGLRGAGFADMLARLLDDGAEPVRTAALDSLIAGPYGDTVTKMLTDTAGTDERKQYIAGRLVESTGGALSLLKLIDQDKLSPELKEQTIAAAIKHPDSNVRILYERFLPESERPQRLGSSVTTAEILTLTGDAARGREIFYKSTAAQCVSCHTVQGTGGTLGPNLSQIGRKYEQATLLETILDPSKAIAPEYTSYLLETDGGLLYAGFIVERDEKQVVLKDAQSKLIRVPAGEVVRLEEQKKSLMPELVLRDVTAQDAADLLSFLTTLTETLQHVGQFRIVGPFNSRDDRALDRDYGPDHDVAQIELSKVYEGLDKRPSAWEIIDARPHDGGFLAVDQVDYCRQKGVRGDRTVHYFLAIAESAADQDATLFVRGDDACKVWVNGKAVHTARGPRTIDDDPDRIKVPFTQGRNTIVIKTENQTGPGGVSLAIATSGLVTLTTE